MSRFDKYWDLGQTADHLNESRFAAAVTAARREAVDLHRLAANSARSLIDRGVPPNSRVATVAFEYRRVRGDVTVRAVGTERAAWGDAGEPLRLGVDGSLWRSVAVRCPGLRGFRWTGSPGPEVVNFMLTRGSTPGIAGIPEPADFAAAVSRLQLTDYHVDAMRLRFRDETNDRDYSIRGLSEPAQETGRKQFVYRHEQSAHASRSGTGFFMVYNLDTDLASYSPAAEIIRSLVYKIAHQAGR